MSLGTQSSLKHRYNFIKTSLKHLWNFPPTPIELLLNTIEANLNLHWKPFNLPWNTLETLNLKLHVTFFDLTWNALQWTEWPCDFLSCSLQLKIWPWMAIFTIISISSKINLKPLRNLILKLSTHVACIKDNFMRICACTCSYEHEYLQIGHFFRHPVG